MSSPITTHVLDTSLGRPAAGISVQLQKHSGDGWIEVGSGVTDIDGRVSDLMSEKNLETGIYRISFQTAEYFSSTKRSGFYPVVRIEFEIVETEQHYHVPLLLNPFGYSTYRGS